LIILEAVIVFDAVYVTRLSFANMSTIWAAAVFLRLRARPVGRPFAAKRLVMASATRPYAKSSKVAARKPINIKMRWIAKPWPSVRGLRLWRQRPIVFRLTD
jgi:hypothetical protein